MSYTSWNPAVPIQFPGGEAHCIGSTADLVGVKNGIGFFVQRFQEAISQTNNLLKSFLLLFGNHNTGTGWHRDWAESRNAAFAMDGSDSSLPQARWAFIPPGSETCVREYQV